MNEEIKKQELRLREQSWNENHESILRQWGEASACYRYMNHRAFLMYKKLSMRFTLPVIVLSTITGTANFAQSQLPVGIRSSAPAIIGCLNLVAGLVATVMQFLKINELMENHKAAAISYGLLSRNIRLMLALPRKERNADGLEFVNTCKTEYDRLIEQSPSVPPSILDAFEKEYPLDNAITKPEILKVRSIPVSKITELTTAAAEYEKNFKLMEEMEDEDDKLYGSKSPEEQV